MRAEQARNIRNLVSMASLGRAAAIPLLFSSIDNEVDKRKDNIDAILLAWLEEQLDKLANQAIDLMDNMLEDYTYQMTVRMTILTDSSDYGFLRLDKMKGYSSYWVPSDDKNYRDRMIANIDNIKAELAGIILGANVDPIVKLGLIHDELTKAQNEWIRLINTEIEAAYSQGARDGYLAEGKLYAVIENGDACDECLDYVGEHEVNLETGEIGVDLPPYHPNCRCVFIGIVEEN